MVDFLEVRLPDDVEKGASAGLRVAVAKFRAASGFVKRNAIWDGPLRRYDIAFGLQPRDAPDPATDPNDGFERILDFYHVMLGDATGFRFHDWADDEVGDFSAVTMAADNTGFIATADGVATTFRLIKRRTVAATNNDRLIHKITLDSLGDPMVRLAADLTELTLVAAAPAAGEFSADADTGIVTTGDLFTTEEMRASFLFDVPVHFDTDMLQVQIELADTGSIPPIMLEEDLLP